MLSATIVLVIKYLMTFVNVKCCKEIIAKTSKQLFLNFIYLLMTKTLDHLIFLSYNIPLIRDYKILKCCKRKIKKKYVRNKLYEILNNKNNRQVDNY
jgi:hypothetical protein